ncbi:MAG: hypothetical protein LBR45_04075, partial [Bacteroidales bacterium]|nr:hypothetical protein [Bacteroidales bacterium]
MITPRKFILLCLALSLCLCELQAQRGRGGHATAKYSEIRTSDGMMILREDVIIKTKGNTIYSDYAEYDINTESCIATGNVRIKTRQKSTITGKKLDYHGPSGVINIIDDVVMKEKDLVMKTPSLRYESIQDIAHYDKGADMVSGDVILVSSWGNYNGKTGLFNCYKDVVVTHPEYVIYTDTMDYNKDGMSNFKGPTDIITDDYKMYCENGWYNKNKERVNLRTNAYIRMKDGQLLYGDSINYSLKEEQGEAFRNVVYYDSANQAVVLGEYAENDEKKGYGFFSNNARGFMIQEGDTLFISSDSMMRVFYEPRKEKDSSERSIDRIEAFRDVRIFREDMQAICQKMIYYQSDSTLYMTELPMTWVNGFQIDGDTIRTFFENNRPKETLVGKNAFITALVPKSNSLYHQIKGRNLFGYYNDNSRLEMAEVKGGKVEAIYYVVDEEKDELVG